MSWPDDDPTVHLAGVESMERLAELQHHVVRDVHDIVDRSNADRRQPPAKPLRTWPYFHVLDSADRIEWTLRRRLNGDHALLRILNVRHINGSEAESFSRECGHFTGHADMTQPIRAVWSDFQFKNCVRWV